MDPEWFVSWRVPFIATGLTKLGPYPLEMAWVVAHAIQNATGQYTVVKDAQGNLPEESEDE